jgi:transaldolase
MDFYLDTASRAEAEPLLRSGVFSGLTTNPSILAASGIRNSQIPEVVGWSGEAGARQVFVQAWGATCAELEDCGSWINSLGDNLVVKVPATSAGIEATRSLADAGVRVLVTAVYAREQALPAMAAGAEYLAPYLGRMNDAGRDGHSEIAAIQQCIDAGTSPMKILVASLREAAQVSALAQLGVSHFTLAPATWRKFFADPLTAAAVEVFEADSDRMSQAGSPAG